MREVPAPPADTASPGAPDGPPGPPPRRGEGRVARLTRGVLGLCMGLVVIVVVLAGWLGATASGLQALAGLAGSLSGGLVHIEKPEGYLLGEWRADAVLVRTPTLHLDVLNLQLDWRPGALMDRRFEAATLSASEVRVASQPSTEPATLPASLVLPLALQLDRVAIDRLRIADLVDGQPIEPKLELTALAGGLVSDGRHHELSALRVSAPFGQLAADATLDGQGPFPLKVRAHLNTVQEGEAYAVDADVAGTLAELELTARAGGSGLRGEVHLAATPFAPLPLRSGRLSLHDVDPARFHAAAPRARLDIELDLVPQAPADAPAGQPVA
ncbi:MAG: hypothetical protein PHI64_16565, partial [Zoogloea sp.]|nr:hypothetical protein [Zoogloea sp.]